MVLLFPSLNDKKRKRKLYGGSRKIMFGRINRHKKREARGIKGLGTTSGSYLETSGEKKTNGYIPFRERTHEQSATRNEHKRSQKEDQKVHLIYE